MRYVSLRSFNATHFGESGICYPVEIYNWDFSVTFQIKTDVTKIRVILVCGQSLIVDIGLRVDTLPFSMIHAHLFSLIFFGTLSLTGGFDLDEEFHFQNGGLKGNFEDKPVDGAKCKWVEGRKPGGGPREFRIYCTNPQGKHYDCVYKGNPHGCSWYNKGNQEKFYKGLAKEAATNQLTACSRDSLVYKKCPYVTFEKL